MYEAEGIDGVVELLPGTNDKALLRFVRTDEGTRRLGSSLVVTVQDHQIVSMTEYRWQAAARRLANVA